MKKSYEKPTFKFWINIEPVWKTEALSKKEITRREHFKNMLVIKAQVLSMEVMSLLNHGD